MPYKIGFDVDIVCIAGLRAIGKNNCVTERVKTLERHAVYGNERVAAEVNVKCNLLTLESLGDSDFILEERAETVAAPVAAYVKILPTVVKILVVADVLVDALTHLPGSGVHKVRVYSLFECLKLNFNKLVKGENTSLLVFNNVSPCVDMSFHAFNGRYGLFLIFCHFVSSLFSILPVIFRLID